MDVSCDRFVLSAEVSATSWSVIQRSPTDCGASLCALRCVWSRSLKNKVATTPVWAAAPQEKKDHKYHLYIVSSTLPLNSSVLGPNILRPLFHLTSCTRTKSNLYLANSLATVESNPNLCRLLIFHVPNLISHPHCLRHLTGPIRVRNFAIYFVTW